ncbi:MAG: ATP-binding protein [Candidatus Omnitrophota bacterium]
MHPVAIFDFVTFLASLAALAILLIGWKRAFQNETKFVFAGTLIFTFLYGLCLFLEWSGITKALETLEDLTGALLPMWWAFILYALLREVAEKELLTSEQKFKDLTETTSDWIWEVNAEGVYTYVNPKVEDLLGYEVSEVMGKTPFDFMSEDEGKRISRFFKERVLRKEPFFGLENECICKDGREVILETSGIPIFDEQGQVCGYRGIDRDITERKKIEQMKDNLVRDVSHTLKSPLATAKMACDMTKKGIESNDMERIKSGQNIVVNNIKRSIHDIESILKVSIVGERKKIAEKEELSLSAIVNGIIEDLKDSIDEKHLDVKVNIPEDADKLYARRGEVMTLLNNLIDNSVKFTEKGNISIAVEPKKNEIEIRVEDTGCGISPESVGKVFEKFYKRHAALPGMGLGLTICKEIVERHNGKIEVTSKGEGKGATVIVRLPRLQ